MNKESFIGNWKPITKGEQLLHLLVTQVAELNALETGSKEWLSGIPRAQSIGRFLNGVVFLHIFGRLLQVAKAYRTKHVNNEEHCLQLIETFLIDKLNITRATCLVFEQIAPLALDAARASSKSSHAVSRGKKIEIREEFKGKFCCYSCGAPLDPYEKNKEVAHPKEPWRKIPNPRYSEYEHIWPHSFGGDTIVSNLAPVCLPCNDAKENSISWEWTLVQALLPSAEMGRGILDSKHTPRAIKMSLHTRAALVYACTNGTTLKDAFRTIGPRNKDVAVIDADDTPDFFNLRVHDEIHTGVNWEA